MTARDRCSLRIAARVSAVRAAEPSSSPRRRRENFSQTAELFLQEGGTLGFDGFFNRTTTIAFLARTDINSETELFNSLNLYKKNNVLYSQHFRIADAK